MRDSEVQLCISSPQT